MRLATWNVNSLNARLPRVTEWLGMHRPDIFCMQETKQADHAFPEEAFAELGYRSAHHGDGRWNGVAIVSRVGLEAPRRGFGSPEDGFGCRLLTADCAGIRVHSVYVPNGRAVGTEHYEEKLAWLNKLADHVAATGDPGSPVVVAGDFNVAPDDRDVWDPEAFVGATHVSEPERAALRRLLDWGLVDVFRRHQPEGGVFSWWDYRAGDFHQGRGMRIDLVLMTEVLAGRSIEARIDRNARKGKKPSDHAPVVVDLAM